MVHIEAKLNTGYSATPDTATGFNMVIGDAQSYQSKITATYKLDFAEAIKLMRELADGVKAYREALNEKFGKTIEEVVSGLDELTKV